MSINQGEEALFPGAEEYDIITGQELGIQYDKSLEMFAEQDHLIKKSTSLQNYKDEWFEWFDVDEISLKELRKSAIDGNLRASRFRSVCWRCLLGVFHKEPVQWKDQLNTYRSHYNDLRNELNINPRNGAKKLQDDNPLSQESQSVWQQYFCDQELRAVIHQDVVRTFPGVDFFKRNDIQELMVAVLFCYARQNPALCYRQGMHEVLAPIIFVLHCDHQALLHVMELGVVNEDICFVVNPSYLEQDSYTIFKHIMNHIQSSYLIPNLVPTSTGYFPTTTSSKPQPQPNENEVVVQLEYIREHLLTPTDPDLALHLQELDIPLQLFGIRWLRLLFGREFPLQDLLVLWDVIFADNFDVVNYIVVAMLVAIRHILLVGDNTSCLTNLMKYPSRVDINFITKLSLHLRDPTSYCKPTVIQTPVEEVNQPAVVHEKRYAKHNFDNSNRRLRTLSFKNREKPNPLTLKLRRQGDGDSNVVEGFTLDDPELLRSEYDHCQAVMSLVQLKLTQYQSILNNNIPLNRSSEVQQALEGLLELSSLLRTNHPVLNTEIEAASEAGETKLVETPVKPKQVIQEQPRRNEDRKSRKDEKSHTLPKTNPKQHQMKVFKESYGEGVVGAPMKNPLKSLKLSMDEQMPGTSKQSL